MEEKRETTSLKPQLESLAKIRKVSVTYTLKRFKDTISVLHDNAFVTKEEARTLAEVYNKVNAREIGEELKF